MFSAQLSDFFETTAWTIEPKKADLTLEAKTAELSWGLYFRERLCLKSHRYNIVLHWRALLSLSQIVAGLITTLEPLCEEFALCHCVCVDLSFSFSLTIIHSVWKCLVVCFVSPAINWQRDSCDFSKTLQPQVRDEVSTEYKWMKLINFSSGTKHGMQACQCLWAAEVQDTDNEQPCLSLSLPVLPVDSLNCASLLRSPTWASAPARSRATRGSGS